MVPWCLQFSGRSNTTAGIPYPSWGGQIELGNPKWPIDHHIREVLRAYGSFSGPELEAITHQEDPWRLARKGVPADEASNAIISHESIANFYRAKLPA